MPLSEGASVRNCPGGFNSCEHFVETIDLAAANGLANAFRESASVIGTDVLFVSRTPWIMTGRFFQFRNRANLTLKDSERLGRTLRSAIAVNPTADTQRSVRFGSEVRDNSDSFHGSGGFGV